MNPICKHETVVSDQPPHPTTACFILKKEQAGPKELAKRKISALVGNRTLVNSQSLYSELPIFTVEVSSCRCAN
jgi:hypothetical protein